MRERLRRHSTSVLLLACAAFFCALAGAADLPDPETYGARLEAGDVAKAREWLDAGVPVDYVADRIGTGLMIGAWLGDVDLMRLYLERGAEVDKANNVGERALMHAAWRGNLAAVELLLAAGAQVNAPPMRWSALHYAAFAGHRDIVARLLERGADIDARSTNGSTPLMMAVYEGHEAMVQDLLARGADRSLANDRGDGALEWAFKFRRLGIARAVAEAPQFAAAASRPAADWGAPVRSVPAPVPPSAAPSPEARDEALARIEELERMRATLASRGMTDAVRKMDRRLALLREALLPTPEPTSENHRTQLTELDELARIRDALAARGLTQAAAKMDRRIAALRARRARADMDVPAGALLEISASRAAPDDQSTRLVIDPSAPPP